MAVDNIARGMAAEALSGGGGGGSSTLSGLTDVDISNPTNGQTLVYNATSGKWENGESAGGGALVVHATWGDTPETENTLTLDKTWNEITAAAQVGPVCILDIWTDPVGTMVFTYGFLGTTISERISGNHWIVNTFTVEDSVITSYPFVTDSADGYPSYTYQDGD